MVPALGLGLVGLGLLLTPRLSGSTGSEAMPASPSVAAAGGASLAIRDLRAELRTEEKLDPSGDIVWWTTWRLCWGQVPGAIDYLVTTVSFEGAGRPLAVAGTCHELSVANGSTLKSGSYPGQSGQLTQMEISMSVSVMARLPDGTTGPSSLDVAVGRVFP